MKIAAYTACNGREAHTCISSTTRSVIREIVSLEIDTPYTSAKCALISPVVNPRANNDNTTASTSFRRRCRFLTMTGSNVPSRSRGTSITTSPAAGVVTVLARVPLRELALFLPSAACLS